MSRRQFATRAPKRPVDKELLLIRKTIGSTQSQSILRTSAIAETYTGGRLSGSVISNSTTGVVIIAVVHLREGVIADSLNTGDGQTLYTPQEDVLWALATDFLTGEEGVVIPINVTLKSQRKLRKNDRIAVLTKGSASAGVLTLLCATFYKQ